MIVSVIPQAIRLVLFLAAAIPLRSDAVRHSHSPDEFDYCAISCRAHSASLADFGGVGDGTTSNTQAFKTAVDHLSQYAADGGSMLYVPPGKWLTGSFNLTSHFTLFLHKDAILLATQVINPSKNSNVSFFSILILFIFIFHSLLAIAIHKLCGKPYVLFRFGKIVH